jgi:hypothetical protein
MQFPIFALLSNAGWRVAKLAATASIVAAKPLEITAVLL